MQANRKLGVAELKQALLEAGTNGRLPPRVSPLPEELQAEVNRLERESAEHPEGAVPRYLLERLILDSGYLQTADIDGVGCARLRAAAGEARERLTSATDSRWPPWRRLRGTNGWPK